MNILLTLELKGRDEEMFKELIAKINKNSIKPFSILDFSRQVWFDGLQINHDMIIGKGGKKMPLSQDDTLTGKKMECKNPLVGEILSLSYVYQGNMVNVKVYRHHLDIMIDSLKLSGIDQFHVNFTRGE